MHAHDIVWTYVQPAGSQRSPCVERCTQAPVHCACWLRSGPGPLAVQDRPPQNPLPHRTALLCSSSFGPALEQHPGRGGPDMGAEAETGVETVTQIAAAWSQQGGGIMDGGVTDICLTVRERCGVRSVMMEGSTSVRGERL